MHEYLRHDLATDVQAERERRIRARAEVPGVASGGSPFGAARRAVRSLLEWLLAGILGRRRTVRRQDTLVAGATRVPVTQPRPHA